MAAEFATLSALMPPSEHNSCRCAITYDVMFRRRVWSKQAVWHIFQNPAYVGRAAYGKTRMMPRTRKTRPRPPRGRPAEPRKSNTPVAVDSKEWVFVPVPPIVDERLFRVVHEQLEENRTRARLGRRRLGYLLQGLTCCAICRYAYYGKTTRERASAITQNRPMSIT